MTKVVLLLRLVVVAILSLIPALAVAQSGASFGDAFAVDGAWRTLNPGEEHWYRFQYDGGTETRDVEDGEEGETETIFVPTDILIWADSSPDDDINFEVWQEKNVGSWDDEDVESVGRDAPCDNAPGDVCWAGTFEEAGTVYVRVTYDGIGQSVYYTLNATGDDVSNGAGEDMAASRDIAADADAEIDADADMAADMVAEPQEGASPETALAPDGTTWRTLNPGEEHWYRFQYDGGTETRDVEDGEEGETETVFVPTNILIWADSSPDDDINLEVWQEEFVGSRDDEGVEPVGRDAPCDNAPGDVCWAGTFGEAGTVYVRVTYDGIGQSVYYTLNATGDDVSTGAAGDE